MKEYVNPLAIKWHWLRCQICGRQNKPERDSCEFCGAPGLEYRVKEETKTHTIYRTNHTASSHVEKQEL